MRQKRLLKGIRILTTDAEKRIGLYAIRYLGRAGAAVSAIAPADRITPIGFLSRYIRTKITLSNGSFLQDLGQFVREHARSYDLINPVDISKMLCVLDTDRAYGLQANYLLPKRESLVIADNKELLTKYAETIGLRCPRTFFRTSPDDILKLGRELTFPCIIKFRGDNRETHWSPEERYSIVQSSAELASEYRRMHAIEPYPVIQEYIAGQGFGYFALYDKKRNLKADFCHKRIREYPTQGGPSSCCESIRDAELTRVGRRLLESLEWTGLAMVEFKFDVERKQYYIIEVNPRYWGSLPLAVSSGVNFPVLHALSALEQDYAPVREYRQGVKIRFFDRDVKAIMSLAGHEGNLAKKTRLLVEIFNPLIRDGFISLDDLGPLIGRLFPAKRSRTSPHA